MGGLLKNEDNNIYFPWFGFGGSFLTMGPNSRLLHFWEVTHRVTERGMGGQPLLSYFFDGTELPLWRRQLMPPFFESHGGVTHPREDNWWGLSDWTDGVISMEETTADAFLSKQGRSYGSLWLFYQWGDNLGVSFSGINQSYPFGGDNSGWVVFPGVNFELPFFFQRGSNS